MLIHVDTWLRKHQETSGILVRLWAGSSAGVARENIKIFTTETFSEVAPDAFLTLLFSKYAGRRHGNAAGTCSKETIEHFVN